MKAEHTEVGGIYLMVNFMGLEGYVGEKEMSKNNRQRAHRIRQKMEVALLRSHVHGYVLLSPRKLSLI